MDQSRGDDGPVPVRGQTPEAKQLRLLADDLVALLGAQTPQLIAASAPDDWGRAGPYGRTATGLLRYHFWMADTSPSRMARLLGSCMRSRKTGIVFVKDTPRS